MKLHRYRIKIFLEVGEEVSPAEIVPIFHSWIQSGDFDELLIDVGDYKHVPGGPGIVLVGLESDYSVNDSGGRWGLAYTRKYRGRSDEDQSIETSIRRLASAAAKLQDEPALEASAGFDPRELEFTFLDRLTAPNTEEGFRVAAPLVNNAVEEIVGSRPVNVTNAESDRRRPLRLSVRLDDAVDLDRLQQNSYTDLREEVST